jgi:hypothetical protein
LHALPNALTKPSTILLPRKLSRFATAYSANAVLLSVGIHQRRDLLNADLEQFYASDHYNEWMINFLNYHEVDYFVFKKNSAVVAAIRARPASFAIAYSNRGYALIQVKQKPIPDELDLTRWFVPVTLTFIAQEAADGE